MFDTLIPILIRLKIINASTIATIVEMISVVIKAPFVSISFRLFESKNVPSPKKYMTLDRNVSSAK